MLSICYLHNNASMNYSQWKVQVHICIRAGQTLSTYNFFVIKYYYIFHFFGQQKSQDIILKERKGFLQKQIFFHFSFRFVVYNYVVEVFLFSDFFLSIKYKINLYGIIKINTSVAICIVSCFLFFRQSYHN